MSRPNGDVSSELLRELRTTRHNVETVIIVWGVVAYSFSVRAYRRIASFFIPSRKFSYRFRRRPTLTRVGEWFVTRHESLAGSRSRFFIVFFFYDSTTAVIRFKNAVSGQLLRRAIPPRLLFHSDSRRYPREFDISYPFISSERRSGRLRRLGRLIGRRRNQSSVGLFAS